MYVRTCGQTGERNGGQMDGWLMGITEGQKDGRITGRTDGHMHRRMNRRSEEGALRELASGGQHVGGRRVRTEKIEYRMCEVAGTTACERAGC